MTLVIFRELVVVVEMKEMVEVRVLVLGEEKMKKGNEM